MFCTAKNYYDSNPHKVTWTYFLHNNFKVERFWIFWSNVTLLTQKAQNIVIACCTTSAHAESSTFVQHCTNVIQMLRDYWKGPDVWSAILLAIVARLSKCADCANQSNMGLVTFSICFRPIHTGLTFLHSAKWGHLKRRFAFTTFRDWRCITVTRIYIAITKKGL